jgi:hypothetical protein
VIYRLQNYRMQNYTLFNKSDALHQQHVTNVYKKTSKHHKKKCYLHKQYPKFLMLWFTSNDIASIMLRTDIVYDILTPNIFLLMLRDLNLALPTSTTTKKILEYSEWLLHLKHLSSLINHLDWVVKHLLRLFYNLRISKTFFIWARISSYVSSVCNFFILLALASLIFYLF